MAKTLIIAEKPSVGRDLAEALPGTFARRKLEELTKRSTKKAAEGDGDGAAPRRRRSPRAAARSRRSSSRATST